MSKKNSFNQKINKFRKILKVYYLFKKNQFDLKKVYFDVSKWQKFLVLFF
jgi:hypothetical protein